MQYHNAVAIFALMSAACGGRLPNKATGPSGHYSAEVTCVITDVVYEKPAKPPAILGSGRGGFETLDVSSISGGSSARVTDGFGCSFIGTVNGRTVAAQNMACDPFPEESALASSGVGGREIVAFTLDDEEKKFYELHREYLTTGDPDQPGAIPYGFGVCEGRIGTGAVPSGEFWIKYSGETLSSVPQPLEIEQGAEPGCDNLVGHGTTDGTLVMKFGANRKELIIYEEGVGCTVSARSTDGVVFNADGSDCQLSQFGISQLGVKRRHFDKFVIDFTAKTWTYASTYVQDRDPDGLRTECLQVTAQIAGELPTP